MDNLRIRIIEIGGTILILAIFIALFAIIGYQPELKPYSNILYVVLLLGYTAAMCLFGLKLSPYLSD